MSNQSSETNKGNKTVHWLRRNAVKAFIILVAIGILIAITKIPSQKQGASVTEAPPVNVTVMTVQTEPQVADTFDLPAVIEPNRIITISAEVSGRIESIPLEKGSTVNTGDLLIKLNEDLIKPQYEIAKAQVERDKIEFDRMTNLVEDNATAQTDLDNATTQLAISKASLDEVSARLERTRILAPANGVLNDLFVEEGEYVDPGVAVAEVVETDPVKVVVEVPERDTSFMEIGSKAEIFVETKGRKISLEGKITFISELADSQTRSTRMEITLDNKERLLRSGQIVLVHLRRRVLKDAIMIPLLAVIPMEDSKAVYVVNSDQAQRREVELGIIKGDLIQVTDGLQAGDKLIISGHRLVAPGQKVNIAVEKK
jgi:membrane fusion protein (multidrug efflux system)